ncbi:probable LRR receptor-like serine/threonine-protein kinase At4g29180 isoform X2 [Neltuma alba]|uniref:probable LRR receptor-like serine/threonine-protein kinase At4g29180 isoform X2 n=1 Tax=Neltuma alba TaxID=207710 RepID=UPI0010A42194|nr:probable LRR receptor-like serine/threonine-protein kinase At4g29180 isoform X2 [Prosopis alba]XP_028785760.1 probable LRR receptor-like serine/threonine-protein kinase At4g29180 isoform X2 [Prosopis alba]
MLISKRLFVFLMLYLALTILAHGQQQRGFVSIDCGGPENFEYTDDTTKIKYGTDGAYINKGVNRNVSSEYNYPKVPNLPQPLSDLRSFPEGERNCYKIKSPIRNSLHLIRASFLYGNYDGENKLPEFDLYVDVNFWSSVTFRNASEQLVMEIISLKVSEDINVCLVNKGLGIPFISALELRPIIQGSIYTTEFGSSASLLLFKRWDIASLNESGRYEDDNYDRIWSPYGSSSWETLETSSAINGNNSGYNAPFEVIRTAARPKNESAPLEFSWKPNDPNSKFYVYLYFAEVEKLQKKQLRKFNISWNGTPLFGPFVPSYLQATTVSNSKSLVGNKHQISISRTGDSALPPILNAVEIYVVRQLDAIPTFEQEVDAIMNVKATYVIQRNWVGDPCEPKDYSWDGLECNYSNSLPPRIISLNLSSSSLSGVIASAISNLLSLESLDLSNNSLTGSIPQFLEDFKSLKVLNLKGNHLSGSVPGHLLERSRAGLLTLSLDDQNICGSSTCKKKKNIAVPIAVSISSVLVLLIAFALIWKLRRKKPSDKEIEKANKGGRTVASKKWQYSYEEVLEITNNFEMAIGKGGFGIVYRGELKDRNQVAVKMLSPSSSQGPKEFQTEAELLMTVHHRNLVSFIGYCDDDNKMALIYEYMANGNLKNYLSDKNSNTLTWQKRLEIAIDAAQGLEYLHHGCKPPIIHRDVKTANILLNENLEAKIADFGLSKVFKNDNTNANAESEVMGTTGYLDPEYYKLRNLNEKSDIYSFGIVILELVTGQPAVIKGEELVHITAWVTYELKRGDFSRIVDPRLEGQFNAGSVQKAFEIAMACSSSPSIHRPTLNFVVQELKKCLEMELPSQSDRFEVVPRQISCEIYSSSEPYSYDTDSITSPFAR